MPFISLTVSTLLTLVTLKQIAFNEIPTDSIRIRCDSDALNDHDCGEQPSHAPTPTGVNQSA